MSQSKGPIVTERRLYKSKPQSKGPIVIERTLYKSKAFLSLRKPSSYKVLMGFMMKRQLCKLKYKNRSQWVIANNGEIIFSYREAKIFYGLSPSTFRGAIDELREKGFIDIEESGGGLHKSANKYSISDRWKKYGEYDYVPPKKRPKGSVSGFKKGNMLYKKRCKKTDTSVP